MSHCIVPHWNLKKHQQREEQVEDDQEQEKKKKKKNNSSSYVHGLHHSTTSCSSHLVPMTNYEVAELTWENGQLAMHGLGGLLPATSTKPTWGRTSDTLESIVHQATRHQHNHLNTNTIQYDHTPPNIHSMVASTGGKWATESSGKVPAVVPQLMKRRRPAAAESDHDQYCKKKFTNNSIHELEYADRSACASANATFCRDNDTTMTTWASFESPTQSYKTNKTTDEDSACHGGSGNQDEERETKGETGRSRLTKRSRAADVHNQSERRRRDRINQKMKELQRLVPNASKTDKASMLEEVIEYLKQLQAQIQMMSVRNMPQMNMVMPLPAAAPLPLGMQQQLQMSLQLARMGMGHHLGLGLGLGMGMGMLDMTGVARSAAAQPLIHPGLPPLPFLVPPAMIPTPTQPNSDRGSTTSVLPDPYCTFLAQAMNMDLYNKMAALYRQQVCQTTQGTSNPSNPNQLQGD